MIVQIRGLGGAFADETPCAAAPCARCPSRSSCSRWACRRCPELAAAIPYAFAALDGALGRLASGHRMPNFIGDGQADTAGYDAGRAGPAAARSSAQRDPQGVIRSNKPVLGR